MSFRVETPSCLQNSTDKMDGDSSSNESSAHWLRETMADDLGSSVMVTLSDGSTTPLLGDTSFGCCRIWPSSLSFVVVLPARGRPLITMVTIRWYS